MKWKNETEWVAWIRNLCGKEPDSIIGTWFDDATAITTDETTLVISTDQFIEGTHFFWHWASPESCAYKAWTRAVSDIYVKNALPKLLWLQLSFPSDFSEVVLKRFLKKFIMLSHTHGLYLAGGDTSRASHFFCGLTVLGTTDKWIPRMIPENLRAPSYRVGIVGDVGWAGLGLTLLYDFDAIDKEKKFVPRLSQINTYLKIKNTEHHHFDQVTRAVQAVFHPMLPENMTDLSAFVHASMDISDGLYLDLKRLMDINSMTCVLENTETIPSPSLRQTCEAFQIDPDEVVWFGGEDYAWLLLIPEHRIHEIQRPVTLIGRAYPSDTPGIIPDRSDLLELFENAPVWDIFQFHT